MKIIQTVRVIAECQDDEMDRKRYEEEEKNGFAKSKQELVDILLKKGASSVEVIDFEVQLDGK